jgi:hypothetical protein
MPTRRTAILASSLTAVALCVPATVEAQASGGTTDVAPPPEVAADLPGALWAGSGRLRYFTFNVYDATLWVAPGFNASRFAQTALALQLTYLRSLDGHLIAQRSLTEMKRSANLTAAQEQRWLSTMEDAFPNVKSGDRITGLHQPGIGAKFWFNGSARAVVADPEFSRLFFGIWLAETTSEPRLRTALLARATS